jgi:hypothetical protein
MLPGMQHHPRRSPAAPHRVAAVLGLAVLLAPAACGDDDGAAVRESGPGASSGSASGSASASASASASGSATASGSASAPATGECVLEGATDAEADRTVDVTLIEFAIQPVPAEVPAGAVAFHASNEGSEPHELVIARWDGDPADLPTDDDGGVDESQLPEGAVIGEIEEFAGGQSCDGTFELDAGSYVLFCNVIEEEEGGEIEAHYGEGMVTAFTVT